MFLKKIYLKNFRCFNELEVSFETPIGNRKHTLILGQNGTGKSNLLKAIGLVTAGSSAIGELIANPDSWIQYKKNSCEIKAIITTTENEERSLRLVINKGDFLADIIDTNKESLAQIDSAINHADRNYFVLALGASRRLASKSRSKSPENFYETRRSNNVATLFNRDANLNSLENWAIDLDYKKNKKGLDIIKKSLNSFLTGVQFDHIDKHSHQLVFKTIDGLITLDLLSDGYQNMASWLGDLLFRVTNAFQNYKEPMKARGLLLIDEIDLHLHPVWQRILLDFFRNKLPNFQLIATTHSPLTAQQAEEDELYALIRNKKAIDWVPFKGAPNKMLVGELLMSPMFGIESDESTKVEKIKDNYRKLRDKKNLTALEKKQFDKLRSKVKVLPIVHRSNSPISDKQLRLLQRVQSELQKKK